jgi:hypothetical protein
LLWLFWRWDLANYLPGLALNRDPPNLSFSSNQVYRHEPLILGLDMFKTLSFHPFWRFKKIKVVI